MPVPMIPPAIPNQPLSRRLCHQGTATVCSMPGGGAGRGASMPRELLERGGGGE